MYFTIKIAESEPLGLIISNDDDDKKKVVFLVGKLFNTFCEEQPERNVELY